MKTLRWNIEPIQRCLYKPIYRLFQVHYFTSVIISLGELNTNILIIYNLYFNKRIFVVHLDSNQSQIGFLCNHCSYFRPQDCRLISFKIIHSYHILVSSHTQSGLMVPQPTINKSLILKFPCIVNNILTNKEINFDLGFYFV